MRSSTQLIVCLAVFTSGYAIAQNQKDSPSLIAARFMQAGRARASAVHNPQSQPSKAHIEDLKALNAVASNGPAQIELTLQILEQFRMRDAETHPPAETLRAHMEHLLLMSTLQSIQNARVITLLEQIAPKR